MATSPATDFRTKPGMPLDGILLAEELLDLAERAQAYTNAAGVAIALLRGKDLLVRTSTGSAPDVGSLIPASDAFIAECLNRRKPLCCRDTESDSRIGPVFRAMKTRSLIAIPICGQPQARGVMVVIAPLPNTFQPTHTAILMTLSDIIGAKLAAREASEVEVEIVGDRPSVLTMVAEPAPKLTVAEMPVIPPTPMEVAPPPMEVATPPIELELEVNTVAQKPSETVKPSDPPLEPAATASVPASITAPAVAVPPALLQVASLPLVEDKKSEMEPGLLCPSEDPGRFKRQRPTSSTAAVAPVRPEPVKTSPKPFVPVAVAATPVLAAPISLAITPALDSWETPREESGQHRFLLPGLAAAAVLVVAAVLWMHRSTAAEIAPPTIPVPAAAAVALPPSAPAAAPAQPVAITEPVVKSQVEEHAQAKPAPAQPKQQPVIEIAAAQPKPKLEPEPDMPAPQLAPAATDAAVANLSKVHIVLPTPPKSELVPAALLSRTAPVYPNIARQLGIYGKVVMNVTVAPDGSVKDVRVVDGAVQLRTSATDAVRQWRYKPAMLNGKPVESSAQVQVNFTR